MMPPKTDDELLADPLESECSADGLQRQPCTIVPLLNDALPLYHRRIAGQLQPIKPPHVRIECPANGSPSPGMSLAVGVLEDEQQRFVAVVVEDVKPLDDHLVSIQGRIGGALNRILECAILLPRLNLESLRFEYDVNSRVLKRLAELGVLERIIVDRVHVCPECEGLPVYRSVCHACHSSNVSRDELIHHYACAHVAPVRAFDRGNVVRCPKCQLGPLIVSADFEYLPGLYTCLDCRRVGTQLEGRARCMRCQHDFAFADSPAHDLVGFRPSRLSG